MISDGGKAAQAKGPGAPFDVVRGAFPVADIAGTGGLGDGVTLSGNQGLKAGDEAGRRLLAVILLKLADGRRVENRQRRDVDIRFVGKSEVRTSLGMMPEAPALAVQRLLKRCGLTMRDVAVVKCHNPFAVNDAIFAKLLEYDWSRMNRTGCSLVWGHPQGPTLTRLLIEGLEEAVSLGGGHALGFGLSLIPI